MLSTTSTRHRLMVAIPLVFAAILVLHPVGGTSFYDAIADNEARWLAVHLAGLVLFPAMEIVVWQLLRGMPGRAARVARYALVPFGVLYLAWEAVIGIGSWALVHAGQPESAVNALVQSPIIGDPGVIGQLGSLGWITALIGTALAYRAAGAPTRTVVLIGLGSAMVMHPPPFGPIALVALAVGIHLAVRQPAPSPSPSATAAAPAGAAA
jgi:hypothetical protein